MNTNTGSKKNLTRVMSLFLAAVMCFGMLPMSALAATSESGDGQIVSGSGGGGVETVGSSATDLLPEETMSAEEYAQYLSDSEVSLFASSPDHGGSSQTDDPPQQNGVQQVGSSQIGDAPFVRYTLVRFNTSDLILNNYTTEGELLDQAAVQWQGLTDAVVGADDFPVGNEVLPNNDITFALTYNTAVENRDSGTYLPAETLSAYRTNILGYLWHAAHGSVAAYMQDPAVKPGKLGDHWVTATDELNPYFVDCIAGKHYNRTMTSGDPMARLFGIESTGTNSNGVLVSTSGVDGDSNGWDALQVFWYKYISQNPALESQVKADAEAVATSLGTPFPARGPQWLRLAFAGSTNFCYKFIAEPGFGRCTSNAGSFKGYALTLRDAIAQEKYFGADYSYAQRWIANLATSVHPTTNELILASYKAIRGVDLDGDGIEETVYEGLTALPGEKIKSEFWSQGKFYNPAVYTDAASNTNVFNRGKAVRDAMKSDAELFKSFGVGIWSGWQAPVPAPPNTTDLTVSKKISTELAGFTGSVFSVDITISNLPSDLTHTYGTWTSAYGMGYQEGSWFEPTVPDNVFVQAAQSGTALPLTPDSWDASSGTLTFTNVPFGGSAVVSFKDMVSEILDKHPGQKIRIEVTEGDMLANLYGESSDVWDKVGLTQITGTGYPAVEGRTAAFEFEIKEGSVNYEVIINNTFGCVQLEKLASEKLRNLTGIGSGDFGADHAWPVIVRFFPSTDTYPNCPNQMTSDLNWFGLRGPRAGETGTVSFDDGYHLEIYHSELLLLYNEELSEAYFIGGNGTSWMWSVEEDLTDPDNQALVDMTLDEEQSDWMIGFFYNNEGNWNITETETSQHITDMSLLYMNPDTGEFTEQMEPGKTIYAPFRAMPIENDEPSGTKAYSRCQVVNAVGEPGASVHYIIDYNINGHSATSADGDEPYIVVDNGRNPLDCGVVRVGDTVTTKISPTGVINYPVDGGTLTYTYKGLFDQAEGGQMILDKDGKPCDQSVSEFDWVIPAFWRGKEVVSDQLLVLYAQWEVSFEPDGTSVPDPGADDNLYWIYYDYNYDGGGVVSAMYGQFTVYEAVSWSLGGSVTCDPHTVKVWFSQPENPERFGWTFEGWAEDPNATSGQWFKPNPGDERPYVKEPPKGDTYYAIWKANDIVWDANGGMFDNTASKTSITWKGEVVTHKNNIPVAVEGSGFDQSKGKEPTRVGYTFAGWFLDQNCTIPAGQFEEGVQPGRTYYAGWTAEKVIVTYYDTRQGTGAIVRQDEYLYGDVIDILDKMNDTAGWTWSYWGSAPDKSGINVEPWDNKSYLKQDDPDTGKYMHRHENKDKPDGSINSDKYYWTVDIYAHWNEELVNYTLKLIYNDFQNNDGARIKTVTFGLVDSYMNNEVIARKTVDIKDMVDEQDVTLFTGLTVQDNDASLQKRTYKIIPLYYTDCCDTSYRVTAPAIDGYEADWDVQTNSIADDRTLTSYRVHLNNYGDSDNGSSPGYNKGDYHSIITFDHALITTGDDIKFVIQWDDDSDNDGMRPGAVKLVLYGDGQTVRQNPLHNSQNGAVDANPAICEVTEDGNTWTYIFRDYQKYHNKQAIEYTVAVRNDDIDPTTYVGTTFNKYGYTVEYMVNRVTGDVIGDPHGATISREVEKQEIPIRIVWNDENNRDGQRPSSVSLALMSYQWNENNYCWENQEIETMTLQAGGANTMTASEWTGTFTTNKVYNDGVRRVYHLAVVSDLNAFIPEGSFQYGWEETSHGNQYPENGNRNAEGYNTSTPRNPVTEVTISQNTNTVSVTGQIYWNDDANNDNIRPRNVIMQLYSHAPGETPVPVPGQAYRVNLTGEPDADNWYYTFSGMPKYADGQSGIELVYTVKIEEIDGEPLYGTYIITENGVEETVVRYEASYLYENPDGMDNVGITTETDDFNLSDRAYVKLSHTSETQSVDFSVDWHDNNNQDNVRPSNVKANLWKQVGDSEPVKLYDEPLTFSSSDTGAGSAWTKKITGLPNMENGQKVTYILDVDDDEVARLNEIGYTLTIEGTIIEMYYKTAVADLEAYITWDDAENNDGYRPENVTATLYKNGVPTDVKVDLNETNGWRYVFENLDVKYSKRGQVGMPVVYSVKVDVPAEYEVTYKPEDTVLTEFDKTTGTGYVPLNITLSHLGDVRTVPVTVNWNDNNNADGKRPADITVQLLADGVILEGKTLVLSGDGNQWTGEFTDMPTYTENGRLIRYSVEVCDETATNGVYQLMTAGTTVYLSHNPVLSTMYVSFNYSDNNNADGQRPMGLYLQLTADGEPVDQSEYKHTVNLDPKVDGYRVEFGALPVYARSGQKIAYNVIVSGLGTETFGGDGYSVIYTNDITLSENAGAATNQVIVKLVRESDTKTVTGSVYWFDVNNMSGKRPSVLEIEVASNYTSATKTYILDAAAGTVADKETGSIVGELTVNEWTGDSSVWNYSITGLRAHYMTQENELGSVTYKMTVDTASIAPYYPVVQTGTSMNASLTSSDYDEYKTQATTELTLDVQWIDNNNAWGYRPNTNGITVELMAGEDVYRTVVLTSANAVEGSDGLWTYKFENLPSFRNGAGVAWTVRALDTDKYTQSRVITEAEHAVVKYTQSQGFHFIVNWADSDNDDARRLSELKLLVKADGSEVGTVTFTGEGNTWKSEIYDLPVWSESDPDRAIQYTFQWDDATAAGLTENKYTASSTQDGQSVDSNMFYWLSANPFGENSADAGYDILTGTYEWETTLGYNKEVADYAFDVSFDDDGDRDGLRPESLTVELLANGKVIDARLLGIDKDVATYQLKWTDMEVWDKAEAIEYTIRVMDESKGYEVSYNEAHTSATLTHEPERVFVRGTIYWDDSTEIKSLINAAGEYLRDYEFIGRAAVNMVFNADGKAVASMRISRSVYGTDPETMRDSHMVSYPWMGADKQAGGVYKYRDHGTEIQYTITVSSSELDALYDQGYSLTYSEDKLSATVTHDLFDMDGRVYYLRDTSDDFLLRDGAATVTAYLQVGDEYVAQQSVKTDADGRYQFTNLPQGLYVVRAVYDYNGHAMAGTNGVTLDRRNASADILVDRDAANDNFRYEYKAEGQAFYQTDRHMASTIHTVPEGSIVLLYKLTDGKAEPEYLTMTKTDADGKYVFENLAPANYLVTVVFNYEDGVYTYDNADAVADGLAFNITGMDAKWPDIIKQVNKSGDVIENPGENPDPEEPVKEPVPCIAEGYVFWSVNGEHTERPIEGVDVHVYTYMDNIEIGHTQTDEDGFWHIEGLAVGDYTAVFSKQGQSSRVLVFHITEEDFSEGIKTWTNNDPTQYFDESETTATSTVSGIVLSEGGRPLHTLVELYQVKNGVETLYDFKHTDFQGKYEFTVASGFTYRVKIYNVEHVTETYDNDVGYPDNDLTTLEEYLVSGRFVYDNQRQVGEAVFAYIENADGTYTMVTGTLTDTNGEYTLKLKDAGNYRVVEYLSDGKFIDKYLTVGYDRNLPKVTQQENGSFTISGVESFDALTLKKNDSGVIKSRYEDKGTPYASYSIGNQDAGEYTLTLVKDGVEKHYYVSLPEGALCDETYTVTVAGEVLDQAGNPAIGSEVILKNADGEEIATQIILSDGKYEFNNLPEGQYSVEVHKYFVNRGAENDGLLYSKTTMETDSFGNAYADGMTSGKAWVWNINASKVGGVVTDLDGNPVEGLTLYFSPDGFVQYFTETDAGGRYTIGLPDGEYTVKYTYHQDKGHVAEGDAGSLSVSFGQEYEHNVSHVVLKTVTVFTYRPETARAMDNASVLAGAKVKVMYADSRETVANLTTDEDGKADIRLISGEYVLETSYLDGSSWVKTSSSMAIRADGTVTLDGQALTTENGETLVPIEVQAGYTVSGMVVDASGNPVADAIVNYKQADGSVNGKVYTDDEGRFSILVSASQTGAYQLSVNGRNLDTGEYLTVNVNGDMPNVILKLAAQGADENYIVAGRVVDSKGHPVEDAEVVLKFGNDKIVYAKSSTDSDGYFRFNVASGTYYLSASYMDSTGKVYVTNAETMAHASEEDTEDVLVLLNAYDLVVRVVDGNGNPVEDARVAWRFDGSRVTEGYFENTDVNGETVKALFNSDYELQASTKGRKSAWTDVTIPDDSLIEDDGRMVVTLALGSAGLDHEASKPDVVVNGDGSMKIYGWIEAPRDANGILSVENTWVTLERYDVENTQDGAETLWVEVGTVTADGDGYYEFLGLPYGKYRVSYGYTFETNASVTPTGYVIDGQLMTGNDGGVYANAWVCLQAKQFAEDGGVTFETVAEMLTDENGEFRFEVDTQKAVAYCDGEGQWHLITSKGDEFATFKDGALTAGNKQYDANDVYWLEMRDAADGLIAIGDVSAKATALSIDGLATDVDGKLWPYTHVDLYKNGDAYVGTYVADGNGEFTAQADLEADVEYIARVYVPVGPVERDPYAEDGVAGDWYEIDASDADKAESYIDRRLGALGSKVNIPYLSGLYDIVGYVVDDDGNLVEDATVTLLDRYKNLVVRDDLPNPVVTGADGYYEFLGLEPGVYYVTVFYKGQDDALVWEIVIDDGNDHEVTDKTEQPDTGFEVGLKDYTNGKATVEGDLIATENEPMTFTVTCDEVCSVAIRVNGELRELQAKYLYGDTYEFTVDGLTADDEAELVVALVGDMNLNGESNGEDLALLAQYIRGKYLTNIDADVQTLVFDINHNGETNGEDLALFAQSIRGAYVLSWNLVD